MNIAGYEVERTLHDSARSVVYRARSTTGASVIIKTPRSENPQGRQIAALQRAYDVGLAADPACVVKPIELLAYRAGVALISEDFDGVPLSTLIAAGGLRLGPLLNISLALAAALARLHASAHLHKDIKPDNVLVNPRTYDLRLIDLSLATRFNRENGAVGTSGALEGTLAYSAPEQLGRISSVIDDRADLYSLGVTLFQLATGELPFKQAEPAALIHAHIAQAPPELAALRADLPAVVCQIVAHLLEKNVEDRYASAAGLVHDLRECLGRFQQTGAVRDFAIASHDISPRFLLPGKLYGRQADSERLLAALARAALGTRTVVTVTGHSGVGKTAFVNHLQRPIAASGGLFCAGKFDQFHQDLPYLGVLKAFREILLKVLAQPDAVLKQYKVQLQAAVGIHGGLLTPGLPQLQTILGEQPPVDEVAPLDAERRFHGLVNRFLQVFATAQSPLLIFLDDIQWADPASIHLLEAMASFPDLAHLTVMLGYRSSELTLGHPARGALEALLAAAKQRVEIELGGLTQADITGFIADTLQVAPADADFLGHYVHRAAAGNIFFAREVLLALRQREFFSFDEQARKWQWDVRHLSAQAMPDNVAGLLTQRLANLSDACLDILDTASCIGFEFDLKTIASVHEIALDEVAALLVDAAQNQLVVLLDDHRSGAQMHAAWGAETDAASRLDAARYRFAHDQVRLTVHQRQDEQRRQQRHLHIGRLLLRNLSSAERAARAVEVFDHLSHALPLVTDAEERLGLAQLGLEAGKSAQRGLAFASARTHLRAAASLLPATAWSAHYPLALGLHLSLAECAHALDRLDEFESTIAEILAQAQSPVDAAPAQGLLLRVRHTQTSYTEAVDIAVTAARALGIRLPRKPAPPHVLLDVAKTLWMQGRRQPLDYENLPENHDLRLCAAISLLAQSANPAYFDEPNLLPLIGTTCTRLTLQHGVALGSAYGFSVWGLVLCGVLGRIDNGYQFGQLALRIGRRYGGAEEARARFVVDTFIRHWKEPLLDTAQLLYKDWGANRAAGDDESAIYCAGVTLYTHFFSGASNDADLRYDGLREFIVAANKPHVQFSFLAWVQLFEMLRADELADDLCGPSFDLTQKLAEFERSDNGVQIAISLMAAGLLDYFAQRFDRAEQRFARAMKLEEKIVGQVLVPGLAFFRALNAYRLVQQQPGQRKLLRMAKNQTNRLRKWAKFAPFNLDHRLALLMAEEELAKSNTAQALMSLHRAIDQSASGALLYQALAERRLGEVHALAGLTQEAQGAEDRARALFKTWGSNALANQSGWSPGNQTVGTTTTTRSHDTEPIHAQGVDLQSLLEAIRTISGGMERQALLMRLMTTVMQAAGADRGLLILLNADGQPIIEFASDQPLQGGALGMPLAQFDQIARPLVDLALRTRDTVVADDAPHHELLSQQRYTQDSGVRSVLASCIFQQTRTLGLLYLENHVAKGAFTAGRIEITQALGAQASIALENARLYQKTQDDLATQTALAQASSRFVPKQFLSGLGYASVVDVKLNEASERVMNVLFADLRSFTELSLQLGPLRTVKMINRYLSHVQPGIAAHHGFIGQYYGDGVLALFPGNARDAVLGAIAMCRGLEAYNREPEDYPALRFGIGIHSGSLTLATIGDPDHFQCSVVGDSVNLAARMESLTKFYGATLLVSGVSYSGIDEAQSIAFRHLGPVQVPGRSEVIDVYECLDAYADDKRELLMRGHKAFELAIAAYLSGLWTQAGQLFDECVRFCPDDQVSQGYRARCTSRSQRLVEWAGIERTEKDF